MTIGVGLYAPCMAMIGALGMNIKSAFPIMMGSCAFLMPSCGIKFIKAPKKKLITITRTSFMPVRPVAVPAAPNGPTSINLQPIITARKSNATPKAIRICFTGSFETIPAPM